MTNTNESTTNTPDRRYLLITPCRNEEDYIQITIDSIAAQTILPSCWVIVDDGSTDRTPQILKDASAKYPFIKVIQRKDRGKRAVGPGVIEAFNDGLNSINLDDYAYLCKLDADLGIPQGYFENMMQRMESDPLIGNISGKTYINPHGDKWVSERMGDENAIGPAKFYRKACYQDINGFVRQASWDGIDGHRCRMTNWIAGSIDEPDIRLHHYRPQGSSQQSIWTGRKRWGRGKYYMGSSFAYACAVSIYRSIEYPYIVGGFGILCGYLGGVFTRAPRYDDQEYLRFFRKYEFSCLIRGKGTTLRTYSEQIRAQAHASNDPRLESTQDPSGQPSLERAAS